jgi:hypothetical protein
MKGHGQKLNRKQEALIAALLTEPTHAAAVAKAGVCEATLHNVVYLCRSVSAGSQALAHLRQLLEDHQLTLKGGDIQELDRGQKAELLGFTLSQQGGRRALRRLLSTWSAAVPARPDSLSAPMMVTEVASVVAARVLRLADSTRATPSAAAGLSGVWIAFTAPSLSGAPVQTARAR